MVRELRWENIIMNPEVHLHHLWHPVIWFIYVSNTVLLIVRLKEMYILILVKKEN